ncbi:MAG: hypothetical protein FJW35_05690 [Acidobacteria bacterium]|nr:hypothetical protein [Acidobacteriota bacterium]
MSRGSIAWAVLWLLAAAGPSLGQQRASGQGESHRYRAILTVAGGGGGFTLGVFGGLAAFDDSTYASRKVWTMSLISAAGGAVGGYFLGRHLDRSRSRRAAAGAPPAVPDALDRSLGSTGRDFALPDEKDGAVRHPAPAFRYR